MLCAGATTAWHGLPIHCHIVPNKAATHPECDHISLMFPMGVELQACATSGRESRHRTRTLRWNAPAPVITTRVTSARRACVTLPCGARGACSISLSTLADNYATASMRSLCSYTITATGPGGTAEATARIAVATPPPLTSGDETGLGSTINWSGQLEKDGLIRIEGNRASIGSMTGELPGVPVVIDLDSKEFAVAEAPAPSNGWKRLVIRSRHRRHSVILIKWSILQQGGSP